MAASCYHCGLPVAADALFPVEINGQTRDMCCLGCQAVAEAIVAGGHADYYSHRDSMPESPREALPVDLQALGLFDHPEVQKTFVRPVGEGELEASLILEGITCAACVWLNEAHIGKLDGVIAVQINYATHRARVRWNQGKIHLSDILAAIAAIGYRAHPYDTAKVEQLAQAERRSALWRVFVAGFGMMQVMMYAVPVYLADEGTMTPDIELLMRWASLILTLPVVLYSSAPFFKNALRDIGLRRIGMDVPVALGVGAAFLASLWSTVTGHGEVYFDSVTMFVFFLLGGRFLEMTARQQAARGVEVLAKAAPSVASRLPDFPSRETEQVLASDLRKGDYLLIRPGESFPADGLVVDGESAADESLLTGESRPVIKAAGDLIIGGAVNVDAQLVVQVTRVGEETRLASIQRLMEQAASDKPKLVQVADRFASRFLVALLVLALITAVVWQFIDPSKTLLVFVSVLVVSCPCALSLATPTVLTVATGALASKGVLVVKSHAIETLSKMDLIVFDKTGTLSQGRLRLVGVHWLTDAYSRQWVESLVLAMERESEHPIAKALVEAFSSQTPLRLNSVRSSTGHGVVGEVDGAHYRLGSLDFCEVDALVGAEAQVSGWQAAGCTLIALASSEAPLALFALSDTPRLGVRDALGRLHQFGIKTCVLSGDGTAAVQVMAKNLGVDQCYAECLPEEKHRLLREFQDAGHVVAMVGDGVNDAPVLAQAQVSIAMGSGTDLARAQADMVLLGETLDGVPDAVAISRKTVSIIRQNLLWAFAYNLTAIPLAMCGWVTPWMAGIGMSASSLLVVLNALRLQRAAKSRGM